MKNKKNQYKINIFIICKLFIFVKMFVKTQHKE